MRSTESIKMAIGSQGSAQASCLSPVGGPDLWRLHQKMYNPKHQQQKEDDAKKATKKTNLKITKTK